MANQLHIDITGYADVSRRLAKRGLVAFFAGVAAAIITACGGGGVSAPAVVGGTLQVLPGTTDMFANTPVTFSISGGQRPYTVFSSNSGILPLNLTVTSGTTFVATANNPTADTSVTITVRDSTGATATSAANVKTAVLLNAIRIRPSTNAGNSCGGADVCTGSDAIASVTAQANGGPLVGRTIRFDVLSGALGIVSGATTVSTLTVNADSLGVAIISLRAPVGAPSQFSTIRATDVLSSQSTSYVLTIGQTVDPTAILITPNTVTWQAPFKNRCVSGGLTNHLISGGTPPYIVQQSSPDFSIMTGVPPGPATLRLPPGAVSVGSNAATGSPGGSLLVSVTGFTCGDNTYTVIDSIGRLATFTTKNLLGTVDAPAVTLPTLPGPSLTPNTFTGLACGVSFSSFVSQSIPDGYTGLAPILSAVALEPARLSASLSNGIVTVTRLSTDPGGGGQTLVRVFNGVSFSDITVGLSGAAPFACSNIGNSTPISVDTNGNITLNLATEVGRTRSVTVAGGTAPYTVSAQSSLVQLSLDGVTGYAGLITILAGQPRIFFVRARGPASATPPITDLGLTFITITDAQQQTSTQIVTVAP